MDIERLMRELTVEEKAALVSGTDFMYTNPIPRLSIPSLRMSDGPHGLRVQKEGGDNGVSESEPVTSFPTAVTTASGWNPENTRKMGEAIAEECRYYGVHTLLGPGVNLKRNPLCGRNFEYFSEDPYLAGVMGAAKVNGVQSKGVGAILNMYLPGQNGGTAVYELLFGIKNPSGKLAETWPMRYEDVPSHETFGRSINEVYSEGTEVGYRYYSKHNIPVRFPFGFGLSYTTFAKTEWGRVSDAYEQTITNTGDRFGGEVAQLFVDGELAGFQKVYLAPGESTTVRIVPEPKDENTYSDELVITPEPPRFPVTLESRFTDLNRTFMGRILYHAVVSTAKKSMKRAKKLPEGPERDNALKGAFFMKRVMDSNSPRTLSMCAGKRLPVNYAQGFVELTNRHLIKGIRCFIKKIDVPKLPKEEQNARNDAKERDPKGKTARAERKH